LEFFLYEIFSFGLEPYIGYSNQDVVEKVPEGLRLSKPKRSKRVESPHEDTSNSYTSDERHEKASLSDVDSDLHHRTDTGDHHTKKHAFSIFNFFHHHSHKRTNSHKTEEHNPPPSPEPDSVEERHLSGRTSPRKSLEVLNPVIQRHTCRPVTPNPLETEQVYIHK